MNKQGPSKIDWTDWTWNPVSGCLHGCSYCYMRRMEKRFPGIMEPAFHPQRMDQPRKKKASKIFVGSSGDMWGEWVPSQWITDVLKVCRETPQHTYQFLTKNPRRYGEFSIPENCWVGTTVDGLPATKRNLEDLKEFTNGHCHITRFVSFEPLKNQVIPDLSLISWVIIGADSTHGVKKPPVMWADLIKAMALAEGIPVWIKDNYHYPDIVKEFP